MYGQKHKETRMIQWTICHFNSSTCHQSFCKKNSRQSCN